MKIRTPMFFLAEVVEGELPKRLLLLTTESSSGVRGRLGGLFSSTNLILRSLKACCRKSCSALMPPSFSLTSLTSSLRASAVLEDSFRSIAISWWNSRNIWTTASRVTRSGPGPPGAFDTTSIALSVCWRRRTRGWTFSGEC